MQAYLRPNHSQLLWRVIYIACTMLVSSYIFFEVLDLDGSDFPSQRYPVKGAFLRANDLKDVERVYLQKSVEAWEDISQRFTNTQGKFISLDPAQEVRISGLESAREHGYRAALPRSSLPDGSPSA